MGDLVDDAGDEEDEEAEEEEGDDRRGITYQVESNCRIGLSGPLERDRGGLLLQITCHRSYPVHLPS